ncbi:MAG: hypothetical protein GY832_09755 [Chloroflexi bacterium]|nr:hypothetical protein [Chloroflexota bacterium]
MLDKNGLPIKRNSLLVILAIALWAFTSVTSFLEILTVRTIVTRLYAHFVITNEFDARAYMGAQAVGIGALVIMGIVCIGVAIGCGEYHLRHFNHPKSWRLFAWTIAAEVGIFILASFI